MTPTNAPVLYRYSIISPSTIDHWTPCIAVPISIALPPDERSSPRHSRLSRRSWIGRVVAGAAAAAAADLPDRRPSISWIWRPSDSQSDWSSLEADTATVAAAAEQGAVLVVVVVVADVEC